MVYVSCDVDSFRIVGGTLQERLNTGYPPGIICIPAGMTPRYYEFEDSVDRLGVPVGTTRVRRRSCDVGMNLNNALKEMKPEHEWALFLGDDHAFAPDFVFKMLSYNVDVVVPIAPCKTFPFAPCVIHAPEDGSIWNDDMPLYTWEELSGDGLFALPKGDFIGQAGMLVKKRVLDAIGDPWFKPGKLHPGRMHEDLWFCHEIQELGFTVWIDQTTIFDHWFPVGITAKRHNGKWVPALRSGAGTIVLPDAVPNREKNTEQPFKMPLVWERVNGEAKDA